MFFSRSLFSSPDWVKIVSPFLVTDMVFIPALGPRSLVRRLSTKEPSVFDSAVHKLLKKSMAVMFGSLSVVPPWNVCVIVLWSVLWYLSVAVSL